jgi:membrane protein implicated in regulation of membrane protease activity
VNFVVIAAVVVGVSGSTLADGRNEHAAAAVFALLASAGIAAFAVRFTLAGPWYAGSVFWVLAAGWALIAWWHWRKRKRRRSVLGLLGYKARALLGAIVQSMPKPAPRLVPQGA